MRTSNIRAAAVALLLATAACSSSSLDVTNPNSPALGGARDGRAAIRLATTGVLASHRSNLSAWVTTTGSYGREYLNLQAQFGNTVFGPYRDWNIINNAGLWTGSYQNLRNVQILRDLVDTASTGNLSDAERAGAIGFAQTFQALELHQLILSRDSIGIVVEVDGDPTSLKPFVSREAAYTRIAGLLDSARTNLLAAGPTFSFQLHSGFSSNGIAASTPAGFLQFNRAITARVQAIRGSLGCTTCYGEALTALAASFNPGGATGLTVASLQQGIYHPFSTASGDAPNPLSPAQFSFVYANQAIRDDGLIPGVTTDLRYVAKIRTVAPSSADGVTSNLQPAVYASGNSSMPIIRREELVLLLAEASYFTGATDVALTAINAIRTTSGGLAARAAFVDAADFRSELLNQRRLSLFFEGHRWIDTRRLLGYAGLPTIRWNEPTTFSVATRIQIPLAECIVRRQTGDAALAGPGCP